MEIVDQKLTRLGQCRPLLDGLDVALRLRGQVADNLACFVRCSTAGNGGGRRYELFIGRILALRNLLVVLRLLL